MPLSTAAKKDSRTSIINAGKLWDSFDDYFHIAFPRSSKKIELLLVYGDILVH